MVLTAKDWALGAALVALDQGTKALARMTTPSGTLFELTWNTGAGFGILAGHNTALLALSIVVLALLAKPLWAAEGREKTALLLFGVGVIGNSIDRVVFGAVTDFINVFSWFNFPIFNVADALITLGAAYLAATYLRSVYHGWGFVQHRATKDAKGHLGEKQTKTRKKT
jgi:lipoprotein signal peptidase